MKLITVKQFKGDGYIGWNLPGDMANTEEPRISAQFAVDSADTLRGLDSEEEKKYLPNILGVQPDSNSWRQETKDYWCNMSIIVPDEGLVLNIGTDSDGEPLNLTQWIQWRFISKHSWVAKNQKTCVWPTHKFYIVDVVEVKKDQTAEFEVRNLAMKAFMHLQSKENAIKARWVAECLRKSDEKIVGMSQEELMMFLDTKMSEDHKAFTKVVKDGDLEQKALIMQLLEEAVIVKNGNSYFYGEEILGVEAETIAYLKNPANSRQLLEMNEKLKAVIH